MCQILLSKFAWPPADCWVFYVGLLVVTVIAGTLSGLRTELTAAIEKLTGSDRYGQITAVKSSCELFLRFITLCKLEDRVSRHNNCCVSFYVM